MRQSIVPSLLMAAMLGVSQGALLRPNQQYAQDFEESETAGEYFNSLAQAGRQCNTSFTRLYAEQPDIAEIESEGIMYTDKTFLKEEAVGGANVNWVRAQSVFKESEGYTLFKNNAAAGISFNDIKQGGLGDCWVLSAFAAIAEKPERIYNMFEQKELNNAGVYTVKMYSLGVPVSVLVDDYIPETANQSVDNTYVRVTKEKELWPVILEKAFAKLHGNYPALNGGWPTDSALSLMGTTGETVPHGQLTPQKLWDWLKSHDANNNIIQTACIKSKYNLVASHAYTTLGVKQLSNGVQLVKVRNPWGGEKYNGPWKDSDPQWTDELKKEAGMVQANDGTFFIPIENYYDGFMFSMQNPDYTNQHLSYFLTLNNKERGVPGTSIVCGPKCKRNVYTIVSDTDQEIEIAGNVHKERQYVTSECRGTAKAKHLIEFFEGDQIKARRLLHHTRTAMTGVFLKAGQEYTVAVESDWTAANIQPDFALTIWGQKSEVKITHNGGALSDHYPIQGDADKKDPEPKPDEDEDPKPSPEPKPDEDEDPKPSPEPKPDEDEDPKPSPEPKPDEDEDPKPEPEISFEKFSDSQLFPNYWCDAGIQILDANKEGQQAIHVSHNCQGYKLKVLIGMKATEFKYRVEEVTEEHQYSFESCRLDRKKRAGCIFEVPQGESHALGMLMKSSWTPYLRYKYMWIKEDK